MLLNNQKRIADECLCCGNSDLDSSPAILMPFISDRVFNWKPVIVDDSWQLSTISNGHAYSICNTLQCKICKFMFLDIRFSDEEAARLYKDYRGDEYTKLRDFYEPGYASRNTKLNSGQDYIHLIESFLSPYLDFPLSILDWGGDTGKNTPFKNKTNILDIYDISDKELVKGARRVDKEGIKKTKYDLIVCSNVLEHVSYPYDLLLEIFPAMKKDTVLYIEVPFENLMKENKLNAYELKRHWHEHINFFSEESLRYLASNVGYEVIGFNEVFASNEGNNSYIFQVACKINT
jgi:SAM-dependent methyltransferase